MKDINHIKKALSQIVLTDYLSPADFLFALYQETKSIQKNQRNEYSYRHFSEDIGLEFTNYIHLVCQKKRNLTQKAAEKIADTLNFKVNEKKYLIALVELNKAKNAESSEDALSKVFLLKQKSLGKSGESKSEELMEYLGKWYIPVVREILGLKDFEEDPFWIASRITPKVRAREIKDALILLEKLEYLKRNKNGKLIQAEKNIQTPAIVRNLGVKKYHKEILDLSRNALQRLKSSEKDFQSLTLPVDGNLAKEFKEELHSLLGKFMAKSTKLESADEIIQPNTQLFTLTTEPNQD